MRTLYIVATPIGNLADITYRAVQTLRTVQLILCEDTRITKRLLDHYQIKTPSQSYHQFTTHAQLQRYITRLRQGDDVALVTDAGTPGISDPGTHFIQAAIGAGATIVPIPGPTAFVTALQASGVNISSFLYIGFLPHKKGRQTLFKMIAAGQQTIVFYESPHRLLKTLTSLRTSGRQLVVGRELTKLHEEFVRGSAEAVYEIFIHRPKILGEFVIIVHS